MGTRIADVLTRRPWLVYLGLTPLAFPVLEILLFGEHALQQAHDVLDNDVPRLYSIAADWWQYGPSLWDPHLTAGNALFAQFALPPTAPDVILSFVLPPFLAYTLNVALMVFLAGLSMHLFLRDSVRLPAVACFAGGIIATFAFWHYIYGYSALLLPLLLWSIDRVVSGGAPRRQLVGAAVLVAFLLLSSHIQVTVMVAGVVLAWLLFTAPGGARDRLMRSARMIGVWAVGALLAAPVLLSVFAGLSDSHRAIWGGGAAATNVVTGVVGRYLRIPLGVPVADLGGPIGFYGTWFPGVIGLICLAIGLVVPRRTRAERGLLVLLPALVLADVVAVITAPYTDRIGILNSFQFVRVRHLIPFAVAANAAIGVAWLARPAPLDELKGTRRTAAFVAVAVFASGAIAFLLAQAVVIAFGLRAWLRGGAINAAWNPEGLGWALAFGAFAIGGLAVGLAVALAAVRSRRDPSWLTRGGLISGLAVAVLLIGITGERALYARTEELFSGELRTWAATVPATAAQRFVASQAGEGRVATVNDHPNRGLSARLDGVDGYETMYPLRYHGLFGVLVRPELDGKPFLTNYFDGWGNRAYAWGASIDRPVADLLGLRWLIVNDRSQIDPAIGSLYRNQVDAPGAGFVERFRDPQAVVYENTAAFPRAFIVHEAVVTPDRQALLAAIRAAASDELRSRVYVAQGDAPGLALPGPPATDPMVDAGDTAAIVVDTPDRVEVVTRSVRPGLLVLSDTYATGWQAEVDASRAAIAPVDSALRGVAVPAGEHRVTFIYRPSATIAGFGIAGLTLVGLVVWLAWRPRRRAAPEASRIG